MFRMGVIAEQKKESAVRIGGSERHMGLEYLRVVAAYMIVWIHAWALESEASAVDIFVSAVVYSLVQVAVPVFVLLSGAFLIQNERNMNALAFWKKSFIKLFPLSFCFFVLAFFWPHPVCSVEKLSQCSLIELGEIIVRWYADGASSALWFLCMLPGLYFMLPFIARLWKQMSFTIFSSVATVLFVIGLVLRYLGIDLPHPISALIWLGCFLLGPCLMKWAGNASPKAVRWGIVVVIAVVICSIVCRHLVFSADWFDISFNVKLEQPFLLILLPAVFFIFSAWKPVPRNWVIKLSSLSFVIYMAHPPCLQVIRAVLFHTGYIDQLHQGWLNNALFSCAGCVSATAAAFIIDWVYTRIVNRLSFKAST